MDQEDQWLVSVLSTLWIVKTKCHHPFSRFEERVEYRPRDFAEIVLYIGENFFCWLDGWTYLNVNYSSDSRANQLNINHCVRLISCRESAELNQMRDDSATCFWRQKRKGSDGSGAKTEDCFCRIWILSRMRFFWLAAVAFGILFWGYLGQLVGFFRQNKGSNLSLFLTMVWYFFFIPQTYN